MCQYDLSGLVGLAVSGSSSFWPYRPYVYICVGLTFVILHRELVVLFSFLYLIEHMCLYGSLVPKRFRSIIMCVMFSSLNRVRHWGSVAPSQIRGRHDTSIVK